MMNIPNDILSYINDKLNFTPDMVEKLSIWHELLLKWQLKINLISPKTIDDVWHRHFLDSLQLGLYLPPAPNKNAHFADFGSGAGFPGLAVALQTQANMQLIESDQRKAIFLSEVIRHWGDLGRVKVINKRIENLGDIQFDCISARALADCNQLLTWAKPYIKSDTCCIFLKGKNWENEIQEAQQNWKFDYKQKPSITDNDAKILIITNIKENDKWP